MRGNVIIGFNGLLAPWPRQVERLLEASKCFSKSSKVVHETQLDSRIIDDNREKGDTCAELAKEMTTWFTDTPELSRARRKKVEKILQHLDATGRRPFACTGRICVLTVLWTILILILCSFPKLENRRY